MLGYTQTALSPPVTLRWTGVRAWSFQAALVSAAVLLPALAHWLNWPIYWLLPMHWPVVVAGLVYGASAGALVGLAAPWVSFALSGMPAGPSLGVMTLELCAYGFLSGLLRSRLRWTAFTCVAVALLAGRVLAVGSHLMMGAVFGTLAVTFGKGLAAGLAQVALLPLLAEWWVKREQARTGDAESTV